MTVAFVQLVISEELKKHPMHQRDLLGVFSECESSIVFRMLKPKGEMVFEMGWHEATRQISQVTEAPSKTFTTVAAVPEIYEKSDEPKEIYRQAKVLQMEPNSGGATWGQFSSKPRWFMDAKRRKTASMDHQNVEDMPRCSTYTITSHGKITTKLHKNHVLNQAYWVEKGLVWNGHVTGWV